MMIHKYKGYNLVRNGTRELPWNIYKDGEYGYGDWCGCSYTLKSCKIEIDEGLFACKEKEQ